MIEYVHSASFRKPMSVNSLSQLSGLRRNTVWVALALFAISVVVFSTYYLLHSHTELKADYLTLNPCMYRQPLWELGFFMGATKRVGNLFAMVGIVSAAVLIIWVIRNRKKLALDPVAMRLSNELRLPLTILLVITIGIWTWGFVTSVPAYDEVFSAVNCANVHPSQTVAFYMLPNNHILYNLVNNLVFHPVVDKVLTGRIISGICHLLLAVILYYWLFKKLGNRWFALLYTTLLLLQFPVWGFSFQGRGYAPYLLCAYLSAISLEAYLAKESRNWLAVHALSVIAGFCIMPSFLFWFAAVSLYVLGYSIWYRKPGFRLLKAYVIAGVCVYFFYLPGITYSGMDAFTENPYVKMLDISLSDFWREYRGKHNSTIQYSFGGDVDAFNYVYTLLFYLPIAAIPLLIRGHFRFVVVFNVLLWLTFTLLQLKFRHYPFMRNMIAHVSFSLVALLLSLHFMLQWIGERIRFKWILPAGISLFCLAAALHFVRFMNGHVHDSLYMYEAKSGYELPMKTIKRIPKDAEVWCSDQSFYLQYLLQRRGTDAAHCLTGSQQFFITDRNEGLPPTAGIQPIDSVLQYVIYQRISAK